MPATEGGLTADRGKGVRDCLKLLLRIFRGTIDKASASVLPILTKVKPNEPFEPLGLQGTVNDIFDALVFEDYVKGLDLSTEVTMFLRSFLRSKKCADDLDAVAAEDFKKFEKFEESNASKMSYQDLYQVFLEFKAIMKFKDSFEFTVVDPLDRLIKNDDDEVVSTKVNDFKEDYIRKRPFIDGSQMQAPLNPIEYETLKQLFIDERKRIAVTGAAMLQKLQSSQHKDFKAANLRNHNHVKEYQANLAFFIEHQLFPEAEKERDELEAYLRGYDIQILPEKIASCLNNRGVVISSLVRYLLHQRQEMNYIKLAKSLREVFDQFRSFDQSEVNEEEAQDLAKTKQEAYQ